MVIDLGNGINTNVQLTFPAYTAKTYPHHIQIQDMDFTHPLNGLLKLDLYLIMYWQSFIRGLNLDLGLRIRVHLSKLVINGTNHIDER